MAKYFTSDFADFSACSGGDCGDWTERYNTGQGWAVTSGNMDVPSGKVNDWIALTWDDLDADSGRADIEILALVTILSSTSAQYSLTIRASGSDEATTQFVFYVLQNSNRIRVSYASASDAVTEIASSTSVTLTAGNDYWICFRINSSGPTTVQAKIWPSGEAESGYGWAINTTDTAGPTAAGWVGLARWSNNSGAPTPYKQIGVGTNGDRAPASAGTTQALAGTAAGAATAAGAISLTVPIAAAAAMQASATGGLSLTLPLAGAASGSASAAGGISLTIPLSATALASALAAGALTTASGRYARPDSDIAAGTWVPSSGSDLYAMLDEEAADDADYISFTAPGTAATVGLSAVQDPGVHTRHAVVFRARSVGGSGWLGVLLKQGATSIASRYWHGTLPDAWAEYVLGLTEAEAANITDYADLSVEVSGLLGNEVRVSQIYLDVQRDPVTLAGAAAGTGTAAATLSLTVSLSGAAIAAGAAAAGLTVEGAGAVSLDGTATASASAAGALSLAVPLSGAALTVGSAAGSLTQIVPLAASAAAASLATGGLDISVSLSAAALASALAQAGLTVTGGLTGAAQGTASAAASLDLRVNLSAQAVAQAIAAGALTAEGLILAAHPDYIAAAAARAYAVRAPARVYRIAA